MTNGMTRGILAHRAAGPEACTLAPCPIHPAGSHRAARVVDSPSLDPIAADYVPGDYTGAHRAR